MTSVVFQNTEDTFTVNLKPHELGTNVADVLKSKLYELEGAYSPAKQYYIHEFATIKIPTSGMCSRTNELVKFEIPVVVQTLKPQPGDRFSAKVQSSNKHGLMLSNDYFLSMVPHTMRVTAKTYAVGDLMPIEIVQTKTTNNNMYCIAKERT